MSRIPLEVSIRGWGYARLAAGEIAGLRKTIPAWAAADTPGHYFKYSDEQTILAARALNDAIERHTFDVKEQREWAVIAAPQFLGRVSGANVFRRFLANGAPGVSPHTIPQHSLHSVAGALSVLLASRGPNLGVGGGPGALADALLTATSLFDGGDVPGCWLVCTAWAPEPEPDRDGNCTNSPVCHAFALAVRSGETGKGKGEREGPGTRDQGPGKGCGRLVLQMGDHSLIGLPDAKEATVAGVVDQLIAVEQTGRARAVEWTLSWGAVAALVVEPVAARMPLAA